MALSAVQPVEGQFEERWRAGGQNPTVGVEAERTATPVGDPPTRAFHDGYMRQIVVGLEAGFRNEVDPAASEQAVKMAIAAEMPLATGC